MIIQNYDTGAAQFTSLAFLLIWLAIVHNPRALVSVEANIAPRYQVKIRGWHKNERDCGNTPYHPYFSSRTSENPLLQCKELGVYTACHHDGQYIPCEFKHL